MKNRIEILAHYKIKHQVKKEGRKSVLRCELNALNRDPLFPPFFLLLFFTLSSLPSLSVRRGSLGFLAGDPAN